MSLSIDAASRKRHGVHYTPTPLADFLAERLVAVFAGSTERLTILDPACGDGELLFAAARAFALRHPTSTLDLVGYDVDEDAIEIARERAKLLGLRALFHHEDFLLASMDMAEAAFDAIITNPPYVRTQQLGAGAARLLAEQFGLQGRIDLTHPFVSVAPRLLKSRGVIALLCSNRFLSTKSGGNVRAIFEADLQPIELYDLGDTKLFGAAVLPAILIAGHGYRRGEPARYVSAYEVPPDRKASLPLFEALESGEPGRASWEGRAFELKAGVLVRDSNSATPWRMGGTEEDSWLTELRHSTWKTFGEVVKIRVGIKTTADTVFIREDWSTIAQEHRPEPELLMPLTTHRNAGLWRFDDAGELQVLYPYEMNSDRRVIADMSRYPRAMAYLESHRERLEGRTYVIEGGRDWFEIWVPQRPGLWKRPKIVFPDISELPRFALDRSGAVVNGDCYWISVDEVGDEDLALLMLGVANSTTAVRFYDQVCGNKLYAGRRRWISQYVSLFPIPNPTSEEAAAVVTLVRGLVDGALEVSSSTASRLDELVDLAFAVPVGNEVRGTLF